MRNIINNLIVKSVPHNGTDTSKLSANMLKQFAGKLGYIIWQDLENNGAATCEQLEKRLNMSHQTVSGRLTQLRKANKIVDTGRREKNETGRMAIVWRTTSMMEEMMLDKEKPKFHKEFKAGFVEACKACGYNDDGAEEQFNIYVAKKG